MLTDAKQRDLIFELLKTDVAKGTRGLDEKRGILNYDESICIELFVDLMQLRAQHNAKHNAHHSTDLDSDSADEGGGGRPAKRQRQAPNPADLAWLVADERMFPDRKTGCHPRWYMQVLFLYLAKYPGEIPLNMRRDLACSFARAFETLSSFDDLDIIWAMRCLDELLASTHLHLDVSTHLYLDDGSKGVWERIFSSVLNIINGRRSKRMEAFEAVALNLLASIVSEDAVSDKHIESSMGVVWKLLVTHWGQGVEPQTEATSSVSGSLRAKQAKESSAGRSVQDPVQVDVAFTAFLVALLNRISLSDDSISVEGVSCSRRSLLSILMRKVEERRHNAVGHQTATRLKLIARVMTATIGSGRGAHGRVEDSQHSCCANHLRDLVSETRRTGVDIFKDVDGDFIDMYSQVRGRSGPDFTFLSDHTRQESAGARFCRAPRGGELEDYKFERSLASIATVTGWCNQMVKAVQSTDSVNKWAVHLQLPQEEVRQLSQMCLELLWRFDERGMSQDSLSSLSPHLYLVVCLLDLAIAAPMLDREWTTTIYNYLFKDGSLSRNITSILDRWNNVRSMSEKKAIFESLEDVIDSLVRVRASEPGKADNSLRQLGVNLQKVEDVLVDLRRHCEQELRSGAADMQLGNGMDVDDDFNVERHSEQEASRDYRRIRFRMWVKLSAATEDARQPRQDILTRIFEEDDSNLETLERLKVLCNFAIPQDVDWDYSVDIIGLAVTHIGKQNCLFSKPEREVRYLKIASFLVDVIGRPGVHMKEEGRMALLKSVQENVLKFVDKKTQKVGCGIDQSGVDILKRQLPMKTPL